MPRRAEFLATIAELGNGVFIGAEGWQHQLEKNRELLLDDWINREEFQKTYAGQTNSEFVESLTRNAGLNWTAAERRALNENGCSKRTVRPCALAAAIEDRGFFHREYNRAYVLVHFFGYLRRNPDDYPDSDLRGLIFWQAKLDLWGDYRGISRAFMESSEYNQLPLAP